MPTAAPPDLSFSLLRAARLLRVAAARALGEFGLYPGQERLLMELWESDGQTQTDLAEALAVEPPTITKMIARLEAGGFLRRHAHPDDGRATQVYLTDHGWDIRREVQRAMTRVSRQATSSLSERQLETLQELLDEVADNVEE